MRKNIWICILFIYILVAFAGCGKSEQPMDCEEIVTEDIGEMSTEAEKIEKSVDVLALEKTLVTRYEWDEKLPVILARSEYSPVRMQEKDAKLYPQMAAVLDELALLQTNSMEDEYENFMSFAKEELQKNPDTFRTQVSTLDMHVRRADSAAVSLLADSYQDCVVVNNSYGKFGYNFDTETGRELQITDVISDMSQIPELVYAELKCQMVEEKFSSDTAVADYFKNTPKKDIVWTLDYNGVTFYFSAGTLAEEEFGAMMVHIPFEGNENLFTPKYLNVPDAYMVRLSLNSPFFTELDGDGKSEELFVTGNYDQEGRFYSDFEIHSNKDAYYHEEYYAYGFRPYYVKTADDQNYLYLFADGIEGFHRKMTLVIINLDDGIFTKAGECYMGPYYRQDPDTLADIFYVPTDPNRLYLDDFGDGFWEEQFEDGIYTGEEPKAFRVEKSSGIPVVAVEVGEGGASVAVSSVEELLEEIKPGACIVLQPGYYNLSETIEELWNTQGQEWNKQHTYVQLEECFDGTQLAICGVDDLMICGGSDSPAYTEIVTQPRYAAVLSFRDCENVNLGNLTIGHTETGECMGNVLDFYGCSNVSMSAMDLYGCGVYGIGACEGTGELYMYSSTIRDCSEGALNIYEVAGKLAFYNCWFQNNGEYHNYVASDTSSLSFYECRFGASERDYFLYHPDVYTKDCTWEEGEEVAPEYGWDIESEMEFDEDLMRGIELKPEIPTYTVWYGYLLKDTETGESGCYPIRDPETSQMISVTVEFREDGTGWIQEGEEYLEFTWYCLDDVMACMRAENGLEMSVEFYRQEGASEAADVIWMRLLKENKIIWLY